MHGAMPKRTTEVRMLVIAVVNLSDPELIDALKAEHRQPSSVAEVVAAEVVSNLESVSYIDAAIVSQL
jgi:hypothetical protein